MDGFDPNDAPLYAELLRYAARKEASFHVPGHKDGRFYRNTQGEAPLGFGETLELDATEIEGTDDLHDPEGVIREAQRKAAAFFGAEETFFLVGGSTVGNLALILTVCASPGDILIVQRNVHKSVLHGLMLAGAQAVFVAPESHPESGIAVLPGEPTLEEALDRYPRARGVLVTRPNYYGMSRGIRETARLCHRRGVPLLVDEAHGAHYGLHPELPASALSEGADGVVQSTHKMLAAMTMGAMLHVQGDRLDRGLLRRRLGMVQSSSPSYPIMASLDLARSLTESRGRAAFDGALEAAAHIRRELERLPRLGFVRPEPPDGEAGVAAAHGRADTVRFGGGAARAYAEQDPLKIAVYDRRRVLSGYALQRRLAAAGCIAEMSDERRTVLALGPGSGMDDAGRLVAALRDVQRELEADAAAAQAAQDRGSDSPPIPPGSAPGGAGSEPAAFGTSPPEASDSPATEDWAPAAFKPESVAGISEPVAFGLTPPGPSEPVALEKAAGGISAEMIVPYPPGIPLLYAGERLTGDVQRQLLDLREAGAKFQGASDPSLVTIRMQSGAAEASSTH
ncbi:aminotransferase class I/II-fold pyridoxal phosphate-dependent enzyme [Saccharibacillus sp. CPCC 101409]|uniref:aminotransferase class I/II-fold pyridoxal phosphate-dependent enzyme n=1 Tax=Saccharibacillus sp. CPCC 101409 TaxID=3058041 RepID=UPI002673B4F2|nr:aminotransferase class I/II-fold pyridoxal phosphate-dependent enzyme [Saccharibacillus sp. CPCC 101409]MDO3412927.1 aminotransferase class I/II-fold pyridoxal phosphate-dependent enzyme [Saccharibacillus sp. CPCC 101409]